MKKALSTCFSSSALLAVFLLASCNTKPASTEEIVFSVISPTERQATVLEIPLEKIKAVLPEFEEENFSVLVDGKAVPSEFSTRGNEQEVLVLLQNLSANPHELKIVPNADGTYPTDFPKLTQAEISHKTGGEFKDRKYIGGAFQNVNQLRVPEEHTDHSYFIRYEGPGWESDKVAYRFYLDWRNGIDVFGKKTQDMVLQEVGQDGFDSYHEPADWGMDILKVGPSLGLGSIATWEEGKARRIDQTDSLAVIIAENGSLRSTIETNYYGWDIANGKTDIHSILSIKAGSRMSKHEVLAKSGIDNFCTGLIKSEAAPLKVSGQQKAYSYLASYGPQSLAGDNLGIAVIFPTDQLMDLKEDEHSHVVVLKPKNGKELTYYFLAAWEQETEGIKSEDEFYGYLEQKIEELSNPVVLK
ncbi:hypothetical protein GCM10028791_36980 [Echinicola sediminis]